MTAYRYPRPTVRGEYVRAGIGMALTGLPLAAAAGTPLPTAIFGVLFGAFAAYGVRAWHRGNLTVTVDERAIVARGGRIRQIEWAGLEAFQLRYYSTRRDRSQGWMQVSVYGGGVSIAVESSFEGFERIVEYALSAARARELPLDRATRLNLLALGHDTLDDNGA